MSKVIAVTNQKGGVGKTVTSVNLGIGLAREGYSVLMIDADPQGSMSISLGCDEPDSLDYSLATALVTIINDEPVDVAKGLIRHPEGVDFMPGNIELSSLEIVETYNSEELLNAAKEKRDPELIPSFSCHVLRHTFATRLCEAESNLKVIQSVMGHRNIETTMDIYAEATEEKKQETFEGLASKLDNLF